MKPRLTKSIQYRSKLLMPSGMTQSITVNVCQLCFGHVSPEDQQRHTQWHNDQETTR